MTQEEGNRIINQFAPEVSKEMQWSVPEHIAAKEGFKYHSSWDWLQNAWKKCYEKLTEINTEASLNYIDKMKEALIRSDIQKSFEIMVSAITFINK